MSSRFTQVVILAEDERSANLLRRYVMRALDLDNRRIRQLISPSGRGDAKQWVLQQYPIEVRMLRRGHVTKGLMVHLDADTNTVVNRGQQLASALRDAQEQPRAANERISHAIPKRHTETWLCVLTGIDVDEESDCKRGRSVADYDSIVPAAAQTLYDLTRANAPPPSLPSLAAAVLELQRLET